MSAYKRLWDTHRGFSQRERVVWYLGEARGWRSIHDIHRVVGFCRLNSRVAEARKVFRRDGHPFDIVHSIRDGEHGYELVPLEEGGVPVSPPSSSGSNLFSQADPDSHGEDGPLA